MSRSDLGLLALILLAAVVAFGLAGAGLVHALQHAFDQIDLTFGGGQ